MFVFLSFFACSEYGFHSKVGVNPGGGDSQFTNDGSGFDFSTDSLIEEEPEYNSLVGRVCSPTGGDWIVDAHVYVEVDTNKDGVVDYISEDYTNGEGFYTLNDLPEGEHIVYISKGSFTKELLVDVLPGTTELPFDVCEIDQPSIAVVWGEYDRVQDNLDRLGIEYTFYNDGSAAAMFDNLELMETYDIIFINCGSYADENNRNYPQRVENIKAYVRNGGSIYASDYSNTSVALAFPNAVNFIGKGGHISDVDAHIHDPTMQTILESTSVTINYHYDWWIVINTVGYDVEILVSGDAYFTSPYDMLPYVHHDAPLAVRYHRGEGTVVYTTFHNDSQGTTFDVDKLLQEMIFSL